MASRVEIVVTFLALAGIDSAQAGARDPARPIWRNRNCRGRLKMPSVLIAGCGYVGSAAARRFAEEGWEVIGWTRSGQSAESPGESAISLSAVDITDLETVRRNRFPADVVVHCASSGADSYRHVYRDGAANLAACFPSARLIFTSSTSVYPQRDGKLRHRRQFSRTRFGKRTDSAPGRENHPRPRWHCPARGRHLRPGQIVFTTQCDEWNFRHQRSLRQSSPS